MADYAAQGTKNVVGSALTTRSGTAAADRVQANSTLVAYNTGAGSHTLTFTNTGTYTGLTIGNRTVAIAAGAAAAVFIDSAWDGDGDGYVSLGIDGTASEVKYWVLGI